MTITGLRPLAARSLAAEAAFLARLGDLGAVSLEPSWLGVNQPHRIRCAAGHQRSPRPASVLRGGGICLVCAGLDPAAAAAAFLARLAELGAVLLEPSWLGVSRRHRVRCAAGHECSPRPDSVKLGQGICPTCAGHDLSAAEAVFRAQLSALGAILLEPSWLGARVPHRIRCSAGHERSPRPSDISKGRGICRVCAGRDPVAAEAAFRARLDGFGAILLEPVYLSKGIPHRIKCAAGHETSPTPSSLQHGNGACRKCRSALDAFYVVTSEQAGRLKLGITSGDSRTRLGVHRKDGYRTVVRLLTGLPGEMAVDMERAALATLRLAGVKPVQGREYYPLDALAVVLDVTDNYSLERA